MVAAASAADVLKGTKSPTQQAPGVKKILTKKNKNEIKAAANGGGDSSSSEAPAPAPASEDPLNSTTDLTTKKNSKEEDDSSSDGPPPITKQLYVVRLPRPEQDPADKEKELQIQARITQLDGEITFIMNAMRIKRMNKSRARATLGSTREALQAMSAQIRAKQEDMKPFTDRKKAERDEAMNVKEQSQKIPFRSESELDDALAAMEHKITHESIPLSEEKEIVKRIKQYSKQREAIREYESSREALKLNRLTEEERDEVGAAIVHLKADLNNLRKQEEEFRTAFLKAKEEDSALAADLDTLNAEREAAREKRNSLYSEMNKVKRAQYASSGEYFKGYRRIVEQVRKLAKAGDLEAALAMCRDQMEKIHAKLNTDDAYRTEYVHAMEMQNPRKRLTAAEAEVDAELAELQDRATKGDPIARREASALQQKRSREAAREAARKAVEEAKAEAKAKLEADRNAKAESERIRREEEERREAERQEEEAKEEARKREEAAKQFQEESRAKAKKTGSSSAASAAMDQLLKPIDVEALPLEKFVLPSHLSSSGPSTSTSGGAVPMAAIAEQTSEAIAQEQERMRQVSAASARDKRVAAVEKKKARQTREAEEVEARRAKNAEKNKRKKLAKAASRDNVAVATAEEPEAASQRVEQPPAPTSDEAAVDGAAAADGGAAEAGPSSESPEQAAPQIRRRFVKGKGVRVTRDKSGGSSDSQMMELVRPYLAMASNPYTWATIISFALVLILAWFGASDDSAPRGSRRPGAGAYRSA